MRTNISLRTDSIKEINACFFFYQAFSAPGVMRIFTDKDGVPPFYNTKVKWGTRLDPTGDHILVDLDRDAFWRHMESGA